MNKRGQEESHILGWSIAIAILAILLIASVIFRKSLVGYVKKIFDIIWGR